MLLDVALHMGLDLTGAVTFACLVKGCSDPAHQHNRFVSWVGRNRWPIQLVLAFIVAVLTVKWVG